MANGETRKENQHTKVVWYDQAVSVALKETAEHSAAALAFQIEAHAKKRIVENGQVDTGAMLNSVYTVTRGKQGGGTSHASASREAAKRNPGAPLGDGYRLEEKELAAVAVNVLYGIYQEAAIPFLLPAAIAVAEESEGILRVANKQR